MASYQWPPNGFGSGVTSVNGLVGAVTLAAGTNISLTPSGNTITIAATGGGDVTLTAVGSTPNANGASLSGQALTLQPANTTFPGVLLAADWNTFNSKQAALTIGNLTDAGTDGITVTGGTGAVIGSGTSIAQHVADSTHNGYLSSTDWSTFNNKQSTLTLTNLTDVGTDGITITNGTGAVVGASPVTIAQQVADTSHNGYLSSTDWNTFNGKQATVSFGAFGSTPNSSGGGISAGVITLQPADGTNPGGVTTGAQTIAGVKTFSSTISGSINGNAATVTTNANLTGVITSVGNATSIASQTGTGSKFVVDNGPTLISPVIGAATGTSLSVSGQLTSTVATGTAPLVVSSTTQVANLNAATAGSATTATTATNATNTAITDDTTTNATMYPTWVTTTTGNLPQKVSSSKLTFNPSTSTLTATNFAGNASTVTTNANLTGDVTSVGNATTLATVNSNVGSFGSASSIPTFTVNAKGLITAASGNTLKTPTVQRFITGTGATYTTPAGCLWIKVYMIGGGGSGTGNGSGSIPNGNSGNQSNWKTSADVAIVVSAGAGAATGGSTTGGGAGGANTFSAGATKVLDMPGQAGSGSQNEGVATNLSGAVGGSAMWGGGGNTNSANGNGGTAVANSGSGGGGAGGGSNSGFYTGSSGGSGASSIFIIGNPSATYHYTVGTGGASTSAGTGGSGGGGAGADGIIIVEEYYQ